MVDNIKFNKILPSLSPARKVKQTDPRRRNKQQTPFKESLERKQKKKEKEISANVKRPESKISLRTIPRQREAAIKGADRCRQSSEPVRSRLIDIRV